MTQAKAGERGSTTIKTLISFALLMFMAYLAFKFIPIYIAAYDFDNALKTQAQYSGSQKPDEVIMTELLTKANELELPIREENIRISRTASRLTISANYVVPVETAFFTYNWAFQEEESAVLF